MISATQLQAICPHAGDRVATFLEPLNEAMARFAINAPRRQAAFLAQCAHESAEFRWLKELGSDELHENAYGGRADLGNIHPGDGARYPGRGLIGLTGRANYAHCEAATGIPCVANPALLELPDAACLSAAWYWKNQGLNELADANAFGTITKRVNGGYTHLDERLAYWVVALRILEAA
jgi:putative chitinase